MSDQRQGRFIGRFSTEAALVGAVLLIALGARNAAVAAWGNELAQDRDAYIGIARNLAQGHGYSMPASETPTAYRPPLYPLVLSLVFYCDLGTAAIGVVHVVLGTATVYLTFLLGKRLGLNRGALIAAGLVAVDPMLLRYTSYAMTETLFTFLVTLLLVLMCREESQGQSESRSRLGMRAGFVGVVFGLCALCRPTIWAFGGLVLAGWCWNQLRMGRTDRSESARRFGFAGIVAAGVAMIVGLWGFRNLARLDRFVVTTTHGGYTLLLGNNPAFYRDVVDRPWVTVWKKHDHQKWLKSVEEEMRPPRRRTPAVKPGSVSTPVIGEVARDRWMYDRAIANIKADPDSFIRACWLRFRRFWNVVPLNPGGQSRSPFIVWSVGLFYSVILIGLVVSLGRMRNFWNNGWASLLLLIAAFSFVHLFYWSNARMRAPLIPAISVIAAWCFERKRLRPENGRFTPLKEPEAK